MDYTIWPTPAQVFALLTSANIAPVLSVSDDLAQMYVDDAAARLEQETKRQFIASAEAEVRCFDGTGTGVMLIDDYRSIEQIRFILTPQQAIAQPLGYFAFDVHGYPRTRLQILQGPTNVTYGWWTYFPQGRSNVEITATWGYGDTIPVPVWRAVLSKAAASVANANRATDKGLITDLKDDDTGLKYSEAQVSTIAGWDEAYAAAAKLYKRPLRDHLRRSTRALI